MKLLLVICAFSGVSIADEHPFRSAQEQARVEAVLEWIYSADAADNLMNLPTIKVRESTGEVVDDRRQNPMLLLDATQSFSEKLLQQAQKKATESYQTAYCRSVLRKKFPNLQCDVPGGKEQAKPHDDVSLLTRGWMEPSYFLEDVKTRGTTKVSLWSDDYWRTQWGGTSYRYALEGGFSSYQEAMAAYAQPEQWRAALGGFGNVFDLAERVNQWSPSEKYDLTVGDPSFTLTQAQKMAGSRLLGENGDVESWMGICHGWAAAAIMVPKPDRPVVAVGVEALGKNLKVTWNPHDIRAMAGLAWAQGESRSNFVGGRCNVKQPKTFKNGRLVQEACFDNNPGTFHLALGNLVGKAGLSFVMDKTFDYQVWNQPIHSYEFTYFNPLDPSKRSKRWSRVAVDYDRRFKWKDRFQKPLTRGRCVTGRRCDDSSIKQVVGVIASVVYLSEVDPVAGDAAVENSLIRETYTYDLELEKRGLKTLVTGGEWHYNSHPDFLWVPENTARAHMDFDDIEFEPDLNRAPSPILIEAAIGSAQWPGASAASYPLCRVVSALVAESSGKEPQICGVSGL